MTDATDLAEAFGALGDVHRVRALRFVADRTRSGGAPGDPVCACHVQEHLGVSQPATSYHMKVLREAGLVSAEKRGRWVRYRVSPDGLRRLRAFLAEAEDRAAREPEEPAPAGGR